MLRLTDICKSYGPLEVVRNVSLEIYDHEILSIVGPSGAGKTTLLQIAGTLEKPDSGKIEYDGEEVSRLSDKALSRFRNTHIGFIFQFHRLLAEFTAAENVALPALIERKSRKAAMNEAERLLEMLGVADRSHHKPAALSGGEKQRVAIARALINSPKIVFADEPTGSLDTANRDEIMRLIAGLREQTGISFAIVTHDPTLAAMADRTLRMIDGNLQ